MLGMKKILVYMVFAIIVSSISGFQNAYALNPADGTFPSGSQATVTISSPADGSSTPVPTGDIMVLGNVDLTGLMSSRPSNIVIVAKLE